MATKSIEQQIDNLRQEIREHDRRYYVDAAPTISDREYDKLLAELKELEQSHPELVMPDSPTQRVAGEPIEGFRTVAHARPMMSIDNTYDAADLRKWASRAFEAVDPKLLELAAKLDDARKGGSKAEEHRRELRPSTMRHWKRLMPRVFPSLAVMSPIRRSMAWR